MCSDYKKAVCGLEGRVTALHAGMVTLQVEPTMQVVTTPQADLVPLGNLQDPKKLNVRDLTVAGKMQILYEVGWDAPRAGEDTFEKRMKELEGDKAVMLVGEHLQTWWSYLKGAFATKLQKRICMVEPLHLHNWWHAATDDVAQQAVMEKAFADR